MTRPSTSHVRRCSNAYAITRPVLFILLFLSPTASYPQDRSPAEHRLQIFAQFGGSFSTAVTGTVSLESVSPPGIFPVTIHREMSKSGRFFGGLRFALTRRNEFEASYSYNPSRRTISASGPALSGSTPLVEPFYVHTVSFNYVRLLSSQGRVRPFVTAGIGFIAFHGPLTTEYEPTGNLGMGFDVSLSKRWAIRVDQRVFLHGLPQRFFIDAPSGADFAATSVNYVPSVGLVFRF